jgi:hypothetical protein
VSVTRPPPWPPSTAASASSSDGLLPASESPEGRQLLLGFVLFVGVLTERS